jgi:hypothetical protein
LPDTRGSPSVFYIKSYHKYCKSEYDDDVLSWQFWQSGPDGDILIWQICCSNLRNSVKLYVLQWKRKWWRRFN